MVALAYMRAERSPFVTCEPIRWLMEQRKSRIGADVANHAICFLVCG